MVVKNSQIKSNARGNLLGHYGAVVLSLILLLLVVIVITIPFNNMISQGLYFGAYSRVAVGILGIAVVVIISLLIFSGFFYVHLLLARGRAGKFKDLIYPFRNTPGKYIGYNLLMLVVAAICLLPGLICIIYASVRYSVLSEMTQQIRTWIIAGFAVLAVGAVICVILLLSWSMGIYLLLDHPDLRVMESIRRSRRIMKRKKWKLFVLILSFIGWLLFSLISFGIALLWVLPYLAQSVTCFYLSLQPGVGAGSAAGPEAGV